MRSVEAKCIENRWITGINSKKRRRLFLSSATIDDLVAIIEGRYASIRVNELMGDPFFDWVCDHLNELCERGVKYLAPLLLRAAERFDARFIFDKLFRYFMRLVEKTTLDTSSPDFLAVFEACIVPDSNVLRLVLQYIDVNG